MSSWCWWYDRTTALIAEVRRLRAERICECGRPMALRCPGHRENDE
jgi:hypothetical protein